MEEQEAAVHSVIFGQQKSLASTFTATTPPINTRPAARIEGHDNTGAESQSHLGSSKGGGGGQEEVL
jgi:hypothetical protein